MPDSLLRTAYLQLPTRILNDLAAGQSPVELGEAICQFAEEIWPGCQAYILSGAGQDETALFAPSGVPEHQREAWLQTGKDGWSTPACSGDQVLGMLGMVNPPAVFGPPEYLDLLDFLAALTGTVLRYAEMNLRTRKNQEALARVLRFNAMLARVDRLVADARTSRELFHDVCRIAVEEGRLKLAFVAISGSDPSFRLLASAGDPGYLDGLLVSSERGRAAGQGPAGMAWKEGRPVYVQSFRPSHIKQARRTRAQQCELVGACAFLPVQLRGKVRVLLGVYHEQENVFDDDLKKLIEELTRSLTRGLEQLLMKRRLEHEQARQKHMLLHDPLTGLPNRASLEQYLSGALMRARKQGLALVVGVMDLDGFSHVNERLGRDAGDRLLRELGTRLRTFFSEGDMVARYGGDEFVFVLEGLGSESEWVSRLGPLREFVEREMRLPGVGPYMPKISLGISSFPEDDSEEGGLVRHAVQCLHDIKSGNKPEGGWWKRWSNDAGKLVTGIQMELYGSQVADCLREALTTLRKVAKEFPERFLASRMQHPVVDTLLNMLGGDDVAALTARLERHLQVLHAPELTAGEHATHAETMGRRNALSGIDQAILMDLASEYSRLLHLRIHGDRNIQPVLKQQILDLMRSRLDRELGHQLHALRKLWNDRQEWLTSQSLKLSRVVSWPDACQSFLESVHELYGFVGAAYIRISETEDLEFEYGSEGVNDYIQCLENAGALNLGRHLTGEQRVPAHLRVWQTEQLETNVSDVTELHLEGCRELALASGIRSAAFLPILDHQEQMVGSLGLFGRHPGQFEFSEIRLFLHSTAHLLNQSWHRFHRKNPDRLPAEFRRQYRSTLTEEGVVMLYQPIVDLRTGQVVELEALARLRDPNGGLVPPALFLPGFGSRELVKLFVLGLRKSLQALAVWRDIWPELTLGVNLPATVLTGVDCATLVADTLAQHSLSVTALALEILEDGEFHDMEVSRGKLEALSAMGLKLVMDDLGSGYSSLLRLRSFPFHVVKVDQALVRETEKSPKEVISFVHGLVRLAKSLDLKVVVEGLESDALVEMASVLGAHFGQGYALAQPMPADKVLAWIQAFRWKASAGQPATSLGRLAQATRKRDPEA